MRKSKAATRAYHREWYRNNRAHRIQQIVEYKQRVRDFVKELKISNPCADCGKFYPSMCMDFDHIGEKKIELSKAPNLGGPEKILKEISKCQLVCANCHRIRTHAPVV